jgi:WD40 repeat protein
MGWTKICAQANAVLPLAMLAFPGGKLACGSFDGSVSLWDLNHPGNPAIELGRHDEYVCTLLATPDARNIVSCGADGVVKMWNPANPGSAAIELTRTDCEISDLTYTPDRRYLAIASRGISIVEFVFDGD